MPIQLIATGVWPTAQPGPIARNDRRPGEPCGDRLDSFLGISDRWNASRLLGRSRYVGAHSDRSSSRSPSKRGMRSAWVAAAHLKPEQFLFPSRISDSPHLSTRQYSRIVRSWVASVGLDPAAYGTHSLRRAKATLIYRRTRNLRAVQLLLGHTKLESTVRYLSTTLWRSPSRQRCRFGRTVAAAGVDGRGPAKSGLLVMPFD